MGRNGDVVGMMTEISEFGFLIVIGFFIVFVMMPILDYLSKKFRGYKT